MPNAFSYDERESIGLALQNFPRVVSATLEDADETFLAVVIEAPEMVARNALAAVVSTLDLVITGGTEYIDGAYRAVIAHLDASTDPANQPLVTIDITARRRATPELARPRYRFTHAQYPDAVAFLSGVGSTANDDDERQITFQLITSHHDLADHSFDALLAGFKAAGWTAVAEEN
jgi:hypothetical protein